MGEDKTGRAGAEQENFDTDWGVELIEAVDCACRGLEKSGLLVGEVLDLVELVLRARKHMVTICFEFAGENERLLDDVVGETTIGADTTSLEVLAHESLTTSAVEAVIALYIYGTPNAVSASSKTEETRT